MSVTSQHPLSHTLTTSDPGAAAFPVLLRHEWIVLLGLTLLAAVLRFYKLGEWSFWGDEMLSVSGIEDGFNYSILRRSLSLDLIQQIVALFGVSEWNARVFPAAIGVLTVPLLYLPIRRILNVEVAAVFALLLAVAPWHIYWSQNARFYTLLLLFYTLALLAFFWGIEQDRPLSLAASLLALGMAARERLVSFFFVPVAALYLVLLPVLKYELPRGYRLRNLVILVAPGLVVAALFAFPYARHPVQWFANFGRGSQGPLWIFAGVVYYVGLPIVVVAGVGALHLFARRERIGLLLALDAAFPLLALTLLTPFHFTATRYVFFTLSSWLLLAAMAVVALIRHVAPPVRLLALMTLLVLVAHSLAQDALYFTVQQGNRDDWKAAFAYIAQQRQPGDMVVTTHPLLADYYLPDDVEIVSQPKRAQVEGAGQTVWFVEDMTFAPKMPDLRSWLQANVPQVAEFDVNAQARTFLMRVYEYDPPSLADPLIRRPEP